MSVSFAAVTSGSPSSPQRAQRPSRTRTLLTGYPSLHEARTLVMPPVVAPPPAGISAGVHLSNAPSVVAEATGCHRAGPSSARVRAALDEMSLVLPMAPTPEAARLAAFESAKRLVARDAMELQSGIAVASDETLDCVLHALRSAEGLDDRALAPAPPATPAARPQSDPARALRATSVMQAMALPSVSPSMPPRARGPRLLRTLRIPPQRPAVALPRPLPHLASRRAWPRAAVRTRGPTFAALAGLGVLAGAALAWMIIGTPQVLARSAPPGGAEPTAAAPSIARTP
jgi:hypothetical protein